MLSYDGARQVKPCRCRLWHVCCRAYVHDSYRHANCQQIEGEQAVERLLFIGNIIEQISRLTSELSTETV